jgi:hypothetical protein
VIDDEVAPESSQGKSFKAAIETLAEPRSRWARRSIIGEAEQTFSSWREPAISWSLSGSHNVQAQGGLTSQPYRVTTARWRGLTEDRATHNSGDVHVFALVRDSNSNYSCLQGKVLNDRMRVKAAKSFEPLMWERGPSRDAAYSSKYEEQTFAISL